MSLRVVELERSSERCEVLRRRKKGVSHPPQKNEAQDNMKYRTKEFVKVLVLCLTAGFVFTFCIYVLNHSG